MRKLLMTALAASILSISAGAFAADVTTTAQNPGMMPRQEQMQGAPGSGNLSGNGFRANEPQGNRRMPGPDRSFNNNGRLGMNREPGQAQAPMDGMTSPTPQAENPAQAGTSDSQNAPAMELPGQAPAGNTETPDGSMNQETPEAEAPSTENENKDVPEMPGNTVPDFGGQPQEQAPAVDGTDNAQAQPENPVMGNNQDAGRKMAGQKHGKHDFSKMVEDGVISQETYEKIHQYMTEHKPENSGKKTGEKAGNQQEEGNSVSEKKGLLEKLLEENIITQTEYDAMTQTENSTQEKTSF